MRKVRDVIEKLDGGFLVDSEGIRRIETAETVAKLIMRIWPEVVNHIAVEIDTEYSNGNSDPQSTAA